MKGKDLGTYHVIAKYAGGRGFILRWDTGGRFRFSGSDQPVSALDAEYIGPPWESEEDVLHAIRYQFTEGNYSCRCNVMVFIDRASGRMPGDYLCEDMVPASLVVVRPDGSRVELPL